MPTPFESATLNLKLFELRREPVLREARQWFLLEFNPESFAEFMQLARSERNTWFRMVLGYWDMAASMVASGAIDRESFLAANGEIVGTFSKVQPFLAEMRSTMNEPRMFRHLETVLMADPEMEAILERRRNMLRGAAKMRAAAKAQAEAK